MTIMTTIDDVKVEFNQQAKRLYYPFQYSGDDRHLNDTIVGVFYYIMPEILPDIVNNYDRTSTLHHDIIKEKLHEFLVAGLSASSSGIDFLHLYAQNRILGYTKSSLESSNLKSDTSTSERYAKEFNDYLFKNEPDFYAELYSTVDQHQGGGCYYGFDGKFRKNYPDLFED